MRGYERKMRNEIREGGSGLKIAESGNKKIVDSERGGSMKEAADGRAPFYLRFRVRPRQKRNRSDHR
jgi:hypothetical protein